MGRFTHLHKRHLPRDFALHSTGCRKCQASTWPAPFTPDPGAMPRVSSPIFYTPKLTFYRESSRSPSQRISLPWCSAGKESASCNAGDPGSIPGPGRSPGEGNSNSLCYSCLEWVAISSSSRGSSRPRDRTCVSYTGRWIVYRWDTWKAHFVLGYSQ